MPQGANTNINKANLIALYLLMYVPCIQLVIILMKVLFASVSSYRYICASASQLLVLAIYPANKSLHQG